MAQTINYGSEIKNGGTIKSEHVSQFVDAFTGAEAYDIDISGSLDVEGNISGSFVGDGSGLTGLPSGETYIDTELTSAQILDLHNTPVTLIPEPTDGSFSYPSKVFIKYIFNTTAYTQAASNNINIRVAGYTGSVLGDDFNSSTFSSAADFQKMVDILQIDEPDAFSTKLYTPAEITGGDGTIKIRTYYSVIPSTF